MVFSIFHLFKALLINEGETTRGANGNRGETTQGANGIRGETTRYHCTGIYQPNLVYIFYLMLKTLTFVYSMHIHIL